MTLTGQSPEVLLLGLILVLLVSLLASIATYAVGRRKERLVWIPVVRNLEKLKQDLELTCSAQSRLIEKLQQRIQDHESEQQR